MKTLFLAAAALAATVAAAAPAEAQVNQRQYRQQQRIYQGVDRGQISQREYFNLQRQQGRIARYEQVSRRDGGGLSRDERTRLNRMQNRASENIHTRRTGRGVPSGQPFPGFPSPSAQPFRDR